MNLSWPISDGDADGNPILDGCYRLCVTDPCSSQALPINNNYDFLDGSSWVLDSGVTIHDGYAEIITNGSTDTYNLTQTVTVDKNKCYCTVIEYAVEDEGGNVKVTSSISGVHGTGLISCDDSSASQARRKFYCCNFIPLDNTATFQVTVKFNNNTNGHSVKIFSAKVILAHECMPCGYTSNCISIKEEHPCTVELTAHCDENALGFNFTSFKLFSRVKMLFVNPVSKNVNENYKKSNGSYFKYLAERDKVWEIIFDYLDEITHDYIDVMLICDHLQLSNPVSIPIATEFIWLDSDYKPEWDITGTRSIAQSRIALRKKDGSLTNSNCT